MTTCKVTKLKLNNGVEENIAPNDIVVLLVLIMSVKVDL